MVQVEPQSGSQRVPTLSIVTLALAVVSGSVAAVSLLVAIAIGIAGSDSDGALIGFFVAAGFMLAFLVSAIWIGLSALRRRRDVPRPVKSYLVMSVVELIAIVGVVSLAESDRGGSRVPLVADLLVLAFVGGLIAWNLAIWRALRSPVQRSSR